MDLQYDFETYWNLIRAGEKFEDRKDAAREEWAKNPEKHVAIIKWLNKHGPYVGRNPFFFIQDFKVRRSLRTPVFLRGDEKGDLVQVRYNELFKICTRQTAQEFNLEIIKNWN